jgi:hypothetical protein
LIREDDKLRGPDQKSVESCKTRSYAQFVEKLTTWTYMQKGETSRKQGNRHRAKEASGWAWMGLGRLAEAGRPSPVQGPFAPSFALAAIQAIYSPMIESHAGYNSSSAAEEQRREGHHPGEERVELVD